MDHDRYSHAYIRDILSRHRVFAVVGASPTPSRPSYFVVKYLLTKGFEVIPVNPRHGGETFFGQRVFATLSDIDRPVEVVDIFRNSDAALATAQEAIRIGAKVVWMQIGVRNYDAARLAEDAGLKVVMNRCPKIEYGRLSGEIGWAGINSRMLSNKRPLLGTKGGQQRMLRPGDERSRPR